MSRALDEFDALVNRPARSAPRIPPLLYHHAAAKDRASIQRHGLLTTRDQTGYGAVFLTDSATPQGSASDVWAVNVAGLSSVEPDYTGNTTGEGWFAAYRPIHPNRLSLLHAGRFRRRRRGR